jgi:ABC-type Na+ efflux pump permease subunit
MGALELLLSTPLSVPDILRGQILALKRQFLGPMAVVLMVEAVFLLASVRGKGETDNFVGVGAYGLSMMLMLVADVLALGALAMWLNLTTKNPNRCTGMALRRILVLPSVVMYLSMLFYWMVSNFVQGPQFTWQLFLGLYLVTGIAADLYFGLTAWRRLQTEFREVAVQRYSAPPSFWSRFFRQRPAAAPDAPPITAS